ncbi:MAG: YibE/F family protein [Mycobacterium sp.]
MAHSHSPTTPVELKPLAARIVVGALVAIAIAVAVGAVLLWPSGKHDELPLALRSPAGSAVTMVGGQVMSSTVGACGSPSARQVLTAPPAPGNAERGDCLLAVVAIDSGPNAGATTLLEFTDTPMQPSLDSGDKLRLMRMVDPQGATSYEFYDYERSFPLLGLAVLFAVVTVLVARWRGFLALVGIVVAFGVLVVFLLPALRDGAPAFPVALVGSSAILFAVIYLAHGVSLRTSAALLGTLMSMLLAALLSWGAIEMTYLTGVSEDHNRDVSALMGQVSIGGLLLAGFIIGSLGVLNDVTITQASTVFELAGAGGQSRRSVFVAAMRVGRDHIASTVYTLVLAYAGSALPLLLLLSASDRALGDVLVSESVAIEIARSSVGGIALALSVPLTTGIAAALATPAPDSEPKHSHAS